MSASMIATIVCIAAFGPSSVQTITTGLVVSALGMYIGSMTDKTPQPDTSEFV